MVSVKLLNYLILSALLFVAFTMLYLGTKLDIAVNISRNDAKAMGLRHWESMIPHQDTEIRQKQLFPRRLKKYLGKSQKSTNLTFRALNLNVHSMPDSDTLWLPKLPVKLQSSLDTRANLVHQTAEQSDFTIVTALFDIGRGSWYHYRRPYEFYLSFMTNLLNLNVKMVIFADEKSMYFAQEYRRSLGFEAKTHMQLMKLDNVELFAYERQAQAILDREQKRWNPSWNIAMKTHPESRNAKYNLLVTSKPFFMELAAKENFFKTSYFFWFDAGFGHNKRDVFPADNCWFPRRLLREPENQKITVVKLMPKSFPLASFGFKELYRQDISVISGGFFGGKRENIRKFYRLYKKLVMELLNTGYLDDDQTVLVLLINRYPELFNVVQGEWFDAGKMFQ